MNSTFEKPSSAYKIIFPVLLLFCGLVFGSLYRVFAADGTGTATVLPTTTNVNSTGNTETFTFTAAETMDSGEISITVPPEWSTPQGTSGIAGYTTATSGSGMVATVLDNMDSLTGWSAGAACANGLTLDSVVKHEGAASIKCSNGDQSKDQKWYKNITAQNWSTYTRVAFWIRSSLPIGDKRLRFAYDDSANLASPIKTLDLPPISANTWTYIILNVTGAPSVVSYGFIINHDGDLDNNNVQIDDLLIGPGLPTFPGGGVISTRILQLSSSQTMTITYGAGGGASGAVAPSAGTVSTFTTKTRVSDSGALVDIATSPTVTVNNLAPTSTSISPTTKKAGDPEFTLTVNGTNFASNSVVRLDGADQATTFVNSTQLTAVVLANDINTAGTRSITVFNPTPGGGLSGAQSLTVTPDTTPPSAVTDLTLSEPSQSTMKLTWTAPGNDGALGTATLYHIRFSTTPILNDTDFTNATPLTGEPVPAVAGTEQTMTATGLSESTHYYFALKTSDGAGNTSALSNAPGLSTNSTPTSFFYTNPPVLSSSLTSQPGILPSEGGNVIFHYFLTNKGGNPADSIVVEADTCQSIHLVSGDFDEDTLLDPGETWEYTCNTFINESTITRATVTGSYQGIHFSDVAETTTLVGEGTVAGAIDLLVLPDISTLGANGGQIIYTYQVRVLGTTSLQSILVTDDTCLEITYKAGDVNDDQVLDPNETWLFTCKATITKTTTNTALASGSLNGVNIIDKSYSTVFVGERPIISGVHLRTVPSTFSLPPSGGMVVYTHLVTNIGTDPLANLDLTDPTCTNITFTTGDLNENSLLDIGETWVYSCEIFLTETTVSTSTASATSQSVSLFDSANVVVFVGAHVAQPKINLIEENAVPILPLGGGTSLHFYLVTNIGDGSISDIHVGDSACGPVNYLSGDTNTNGQLEQGETWRFICQATFTESRQHSMVAWGRAGEQPVASFRQSFIIVTNSPLPEDPLFPPVDSTITGEYSPKIAFESTPTIEVDLSEAFTAVEATNCPPGTLLKGPASTIYYCSSSENRHIFLDEKTFKTWYTDFSNVLTVDNTVLSLIRLGEVIHQRPGLRMVKIESDPKVYAISRGGVLRWITNESVARALYGENWNTFINDLDVTLFNQYTIGDPITDSDIPAELQLPPLSPVISPTPESPTTEPTCSSNVFFTAFMTLDSVGSQVRALQELLQCLGYFPASIDSTGIFGPITSQSVQAFQSAHGIEPVGYVGPATREALNTYFVE